MPCGPASLLLVLGLGRVLDSSSIDDAAASASSVDVVPTHIEADLIARDWSHATSDTSDIQILPRRKWLRHRVRSRERVTQIAARYGVRLEDLLEWNDLDPSQTYPPKRRRSLKVFTDRVPPPRRRVRYIPKPDEGWGDIAARFHVEGRDLRAWNWRTRSPKPGKPVIVWVDPAMRPTVRSDPGTPVPDPGITIPDGGLSVGRPQRGRLQDGVQLPASTLYTRRTPRILYGSSHTVSQIVKAFAAFRHRTGYEGEIVIGSMSRRTGRRLRPHVSHQSGRDIDIRLPRLPGVPETTNPNPDEIDWYAAWGLIEAFIDTGEVALIFLDVHLQRHLYEAARAMGRTPDELGGVIQWPFPEGAPRGLVRHSDGHDGHIHVRIRCSADEPRCRPRRRKAKRPATSEESGPAGGELVNSAP